MRAQANEIIPVAAEYDRTMKVRLRIHFAFSFPKLPLGGLR